MLKSNRDSNHSLRDHVNHHSKFCSDINWTNNSTLNVLICLFLNIALRTKFYKGLVLIQNVNCLFEGYALAQKQQKVTENNSSDVKLCMLK